MSTNRHRPPFSPPFSPSFRSPSAAAYRPSASASPSLRRRPSSHRSSGKNDSESDREASDSFLSIEEEESSQRLPFEFKVQLIRDIERLGGLDVFKLRSLLKFNAGAYGSEHLSYKSPLYRKLSNLHQRWKKHPAEYASFLDSLTIRAPISNVDESNDLFLITPTSIPESPPARIPGSNMSLYTAFLPHGFNPRYIGKSIVFPAHTFIAHF
jgi:hypothetical protein